MAVVRYFKTKGAGAAADSSSETVPAGTTVLIKKIDITAPAQANAGVKIYAGAIGNANTVVAAGQMDKCIDVPADDGAVEGPMDIRIELDNSANASGAFLGCVIYYEVL